MSQRTITARCHGLEIRAVGDIMLGNNHLHINRGVGTRWRGRELPDILGHLKNDLKGTLCIGNLECVLSHIPSRNPKSMIYLADPERAAELKRLGFTHLCLANNHILDHGMPHALATIRNLHDASLSACGIGNPSVCRYDEAAIEIFNFSLVPVRRDDNLYCNRISGKELEAIEQSSADYKIVVIHWGDEYSRYPSPEQIELGREFVKRGAQLIIGHHPHVLQGVEKYRNGIIAYSLGNFIFDQNWSAETSTGCILQVAVKRDGSQEVKTIVTRQDKGYIPYQTEEGNLSMISDEVIKYCNNQHGYHEYVSKRLLWARLAMKMEVILHMNEVDINTLFLLIAKRCKFFRK